MSGPVLLAAVLAAWAIAWGPATARAVDPPGERRPAPAARAEQAVARPGTLATGGGSRLEPSGGSSGVPEYRPPIEEERSLAWDGIRMALSLALVLGVLGLGVKLLRRWPGLRQGGAAVGGLHVMGRLALGAKETICLVKVGREILVLGVTPGAVSLLHRVDDEGAGRLPFGDAAGARSSGADLARPASHRLRGLAERLRDVQASWRIPTAGAGREP